MRIRRCPGRVRSTATTGKAATTRTEGTALRTALQGRVHRPTDVDPVKRAVPREVKDGSRLDGYRPGTGKESPLRSDGLVKRASSEPTRLRPIGAAADYLMPPG